MKIFLADDHQLFLEGMQSILRTIQPTAEISFENNGLDALKTLKMQLFDIALIDLRLPRLNGFDLLTELSNVNCLTPIIIVSASEDPNDIQRAIELGALGYVPKSSNAQQISHAIESVLKGDIIHPENNQAIATSKQKYYNWASQHDITPRQLEVLRLIRQGLSNQAIADKLFISTSTVKTHLVTLYRLLKTSNRTETIKKAQQLGLD